MLTKILVGVDETAGAVDAAEFADDVARATGADLLLMNAYQDPLLPFPLTLGGSPTQRLRDAEELLRTLRPVHAPHGHTRAVPDFSCSRALRRTAKAEGADLIVLGGGHAPSTSGVHIGHTGRQVIHGAACAVAFVANGYRHVAPALGRVVVGLDGSPESVHALRAATQLAKAAGAEIAAVCVLDDRVPLVWTPVGLSAEMARWDETMKRRHDRIADRVKELVPDRDEIRSEIVVGDPVEQLARAAAESDLLVLGSRSWGPAGHISLGSTADALCHGSPCSVLIVPRPDPAASPPLGAAEAASTANGTRR